jgi:ADP-heptose:LPS heptosyltransferase
MIVHKAITFRASSIGDCLMGKYFLENVHAAYPKARCAIVISSRAAMISDLLAGYPWIEVIEVNRRNPKTILSLIFSWWGSDIVLTQYAGKPGGKFSLSSKFVARLLARSGALIGFKDASSFGFLYSRLLPFTASRAVLIHEQLALLAARIPIAFPELSFSFVPKEGVPEKIKLSNNGYIVVHLFSGSISRGLTFENQQNLLTELLSALPPNISLVLTGAAADKPKTAALIEAMNDTRVVDVAGKYSLQETANLLSHSKGLVSVDTGIAHIGVQIGKQAIIMTSCPGLHWNSKEQYPERATIFNRNDLCVPSHVSADYPPCLNAIDMKEVSRVTALTLARKED